MAADPDRTVSDQAVIDLIDWVVDEAVSRVAEITGVDSGWVPSDATRRGLTGDTRLARLLVGVGADDGRLAADEIFDGRPQSVAEATANLGRWAAAATRTADDVRQLLRVHIAEILRASEQADAKAKAEAGADTAPRDDSGGRLRLAVAAISLDPDAAGLEDALAAVARAVVSGAHRPAISSLITVAPTVVQLLREAGSPGRSLVLGQDALAAFVGEISQRGWYEQYSSAISGVSVQMIATLEQMAPPIPPRRRTLQEALVRLDGLTAGDRRRAIGETAVWNRLGLDAAPGALEVASTLVQHRLDAIWPQLSKADMVKLWFLDALHASITAHPLEVPRSLARALSHLPPGEEGRALVVAVAGLTVALAQSKSIGDALMIPGADACLATIHVLADADEPRAAATAIADATRPRTDPSGDEPADVIEAVRAAVAILNMGDPPEPDQPGPPSLGVWRDDSEAMTGWLARAIGSVWLRASDNTEGKAITTVVEIARARGDDANLVQAIKDAWTSAGVPTGEDLRRAVPSIGTDADGTWITNARSSLGEALRALPAPLRERPRPHADDEDPSGTEESDDGSSSDDSSTS